LLELLWPNSFKELLRMQFWHSISTVFGFRTVPTTLLIILVYVAAFSAVLVTDGLPDVPMDQGGLNLHQAYTDLHQVRLSIHTVRFSDNKPLF
jgi:hypothetical protein